jgi:hypothetical protein
VKPHLHPWQCTSYPPPYLKQGPAASAPLAEEVRRQAMRLGLETLDLTLTHEQALISRALHDVIAQVLTGGGEFTVESVPGHGTTIQAQIPLLGIKIGHQGSGLNPSIETERSPAPTQPTKRHRQSDLRF